MCPDHQILSVYVDGELPSPWKEKLEAHLASCPRCAERLAAFSGLANRLGCGEPAAAALAQAQERVWLRLSRTTPAQAACRKPRTGIWRRRVSVPLPAVMGAAAALCLAGALALNRQAGNPAAEAAVAPPSRSITAAPMPPVSTINEVLQYLGSQEAAEIMLLRLPESKNFSSSGEPVLIKAADYSRSGNAQ